MTTFCFGVLCAKHGSCSLYQDLDGHVGDYHAIATCGPSQSEFRPMSKASPQYELIDKQILDVITTLDGAHLDSIYLLTRDEANRLARLANRDTLRVLDGRLQSLRKSNKIRFIRGKGWVLV